MYATVDEYNSFFYFKAVIKSMMCLMIQGLLEPKNVKLGIEGFELCQPSCFILP